MENYRGFKEVVDNYSGVYVNQLDIYLKVLGQYDLRNFNSEELKLIGKDLNDLIKSNRKQISEKKRKLIMPVFLAIVGIIASIMSLSYGVTLFTAGSLIVSDVGFILNQIVPKVRALVKRKKNDEKAQDLIVKTKETIDFQVIKERAIDTEYENLTVNNTLGKEKSVREMYDFIVDSLELLSPDMASYFMTRLHTIFSSYGKIDTNNKKVLEALESLADQIVERLNMEGNLDNLVNRVENIGSSVSL